MKITRSVSIDIDLWRSCRDIATDHRSTFSRLVEDALLYATAPNKMDRFPDDPKVNVRIEPPATHSGQRLETSDGSRHVAPGKAGGK